MFIKNKLKWEIEHSSLYRQSLIKQMIVENLTWAQCRDFSRKDIAYSLTPTITQRFITELPEDHRFCYLARVDTSSKKRYEPDNYYFQFRKRNYISFSTVTNENISHYVNKNGDFMLAYSIPPEAIAHVFPCDSDTDTNAQLETNLTSYPSLWLTLDDLNEATKKLGVYNQVTCATRIGGKILRPKTLIAFETLTDEARAIAKKFHINCLILHPNKNAINYSNDLLCDKEMLKKVTQGMKEQFDLTFPEPVLHMF